MKTIKQWLESIEDPEVRERALKCMEAGKSNVVVAHMHQAVFLGILWGDAGGFEYWHSVYCHYLAQLSEIPEAIQFAEWIRRNVQPLTINKNWIFTSKEEVTTEQLYEIFKNNQ